MKKTTYLLAILLALATLLTSCNSVKGVFDSQGVDKKAIVGEWEMKRKDGTGIYLALEGNGRYLYEEFRKNGEQVLFSYSGKYKMGNSYITLTDLAENDGRDEYFKVLFPETEDGKEVMRLIATLIRSYDFVRVGGESAATSSKEERVVPTVTISTSNSNSGNKLTSASLDGAWSIDGGTVIISGRAVTVVTEGGTAVGALERSALNTLTVTFPEGSYVKNIIDASYYLLDDSLTVAVGNERYILKRLS